MVPSFLDIQGYLKAPALLFVLEVPLILARLFDQENQVDLQDQGNQGGPCFLVFQLVLCLLVCPVLP